MIKKTIFTYLFCLILMSSGVSAEVITPGQLLKNKISSAKANIQSIDVSTLNNWIVEDEKEFLLLDVREPGEVSAGKIEAEEYLAIPRGLVEMQFIRKVTDLDQPVVVYCLKGSRGALATQALKELGYTNVYNLQGGLLSWIAEGYPVSNFFGEFELDNFESNFEKKG